MAFLETKKNDTTSKDQHFITINIVLGTEKIPSPHVAGKPSQPVRIITKTWVQFSETLVSYEHKMGLKKFFTNGLLRNCDFGVFALEPMELRSFRTGTRSKPRYERFFLYVPLLRSQQKFRYVFRKCSLSKIMEIKNVAQVYHSCEEIIFKFH